MADYFVEAFELLEACVDDPAITVEDIGEIAKPLPKSLVEDPSVSGPLLEEKPHRLT